ncbi:MAG: hypothetical protein RLZZ414_788 [Bacteroidota bacterium]|jgi:hypothetical protein
MNNYDLNILTKSLNLIGNFYNDVSVISSIDEFLIIHNRNITILKELSKLENKNYYIEKCNEYPKFTKEELLEYFRDKTKEKSIFSILGSFFEVLEYIYKIIKTKGNNLGKTSDKLKQVKSINETLVYLIKNMQ